MNSQEYLASKAFACACKVFLISSPSIMLIQFARDTGTHPADSRMLCLPQPLASKVISPSTHCPGETLKTPGETLKTKSTAHPSMKKKFSSQDQPEYSRRLASNSVFYPGPVYVRN